MTDDAPRASRSTSRPSRSGPVVPGTTPWRWPTASTGATTSDLTLVARRGDEQRWHTLAGRRRGARRGPDVAAGPAGLRAAPPRLRAALPRRPGAPRSALHDAGPVAGAVCRDDPRLHLLRPSRMAPALQGGVLPPRHPPRRSARRRADLREPGDRGPAARLVRRACTGRGGAARRRPPSGSRRTSRRRAPTAPCSAALGVPVDRPLVAFVGTLEPRKGVAPLVGRLRPGGAPPPRRRPGPRAGRPAGAWPRPSGPLPPPAIPSASCARATCPTTAVPALLRQAAVVAYPALEEGFGLPALEALACGAPLVTTEGTAMAEMAGGAALLVPPGDVAALAGRARNGARGGPGHGPPVSRDRRGGGADLGGERRRCTVRAYAVARAASQ